MYVADFCCYQVRLIVELEGEIHRQRRLQDLQRQEELEAMGYRVLRFSNEQVINDLEDVLAEIIRVAGELQ